MSITEYNGGALLAMTGKDCVAIAADRRFGIQAQTVSCDFQKIFKMGPKVYVGLPGLATDVQTVYNSFALVGTTNIKHLLSNIRSVHIQLNKSELKFLEGGSSNQSNEYKKIVSPKQLLEEIPTDAEIQFNVFKWRQTISNIISGKDDRIICITGPCSIHDPEAAFEFAKKLKATADKYEKEVFVIMRVYFEKPRTTVGWKGLVNDPDLNGQYNINKGLRLGRSILRRINAMGLPCATEFLDTISPLYMSDLISWGAIGARTTESQLHREMVSSLPVPIGFKNGTQGNHGIAVDAILSSSQPHRFLGAGPNKEIEIVLSTGNPDCHMILRGGSQTGPNFTEPFVTKAAEDMKKKNCFKKIIIDCSHGNSSKKHDNQPLVCKDIAEQIKNGSLNIAGVMIESNLVEGNQSLKPGVTDVSSLIYGKSCTDACVDVATNTEMVKCLAEAVQFVRS